MRFARKSPTGGFVLFPDSANPFNIAPGDDDVLINSERLIAGLEDVEEAETMLDKAINLIGRLAKARWKEWRKTAHLNRHAPKGLNKENAEIAALTFLHLTKSGPTGLDDDEAWNRAFKRLAVTQLWESAKQNRRKSC